MSSSQQCRVALSVALTAGSTAQLLPAGSFRSIDGRPKGLVGWRVDGAVAARLIAQINQRGSDLVIDYDHQTLYAEKNGQPAPAAGWFKRLEWRDGVGVFATDVRWTDKARQMIQAGEYKYISPVMGFDAKTGEVTNIFHAALVNAPGLDGMAVVSLSALPGDTATPTLSSDELGVCRAMGLSPDAYLSTKASDAAACSAGLTAPTFAGLAADQLTVCQRLGIEPAAYLKTLQQE